MVERRGWEGASVLRDAANQILADETHFEQRGQLCFTYHLFRQRVIGVDVEDMEVLVQLLQHPRVAEKQRTIHLLLEINQHPIEIRGIFVTGALHRERMELDQ